MRKFIFSRQHDTAVPTRVVALGSTPEKNANGDRSSGAGHEFLQLQRTYGNRHVQRLMNSGREKFNHAPVLQTKLMLGAANDKYERQADDVARQVVRQIPELSRAMRQPASSSEMMKHAADTQRLHGTEGGAVDVGVQQTIHNARGMGQAIPDTVRVPLEQAFGADFSEVRLHTDSQSDQLNHSLQARAFTTGQDIFFRRGQYDLTSPSGQETIAHELTHVVQQRCATPTGIIQRKNKITNTNADDVEHPVEVLHQAFKLSHEKLKAEEGYVLGDKICTPVGYPTNTIGSTPKRAKKVVAKLDGYRSGGPRTGNLTQTAYGHLGEFERVIFGRNTAAATYQGGHLVPDQILGDRSYIQENFAPQLKHANSPDYRVVELLADEGPVNKKEQTARSQEEEWTMTVELSYDQNYDIPVADLVARGIIIPGIAKTDSGSTTVRFPRRVPHTWKVELSAPAGYKFPKTEVSGESQLIRFHGTAMDNTLKNAPLSRQKSQLTLWGFQSAQQDPETKEVWIGGKDKEYFSAIQSVPMPESEQPHYMGTAAHPVKPMLPAAQFKPVLSKPIEIMDIIAEEDDDGPAGHKFIKNFSKTAGEDLAIDVHSRLRHLSYNLYDPTSTRLEELLGKSATRKIALITALRTQKRLGGTTIKPLTRKQKVKLYRLSRDPNLTLDYPRLEAAVKENRRRWKEERFKPSSMGIKKKIVKPKRFTKRK